MFTGKDEEKKGFCGIRFDYLIGKKSILQIYKFSKEKLYMKKMFLAGALVLGAMSNSVLANDGTIMTLTGTIMTIVNAIAGTIMT